MLELINPCYRLIIKTLEGEELVYEQIGLESELKIEYEITKTRASHPNPAFFSIYNMAPQSMELVAKRWKPEYEEGHKLQFFFGYRGFLSEAGELDLLYEGEIRTAVSRWEGEGTEMVMKIEAGTEWTKIKGKPLNFSFEGKKDGEQVINMVGTHMGKKVGFLDESFLFVKKRFFNGKNLFANAKAILDEFGKPLDVNIDVSPGEIKVSQFGERDPGKPTIYLNKNSTMIGIPEVTKKGVNVKALLQTEIEPGCLVEVVSESLSVSYGRDFVAEVIKYTGDTFEGAAVASIECYTVGVFLR